MLRGEINQALKLDILLACMTDDEVSPLDVLCYRVFESISFQIDVWTALRIWKKGPISHLKNQTLVPTTF